MKKYFLPFFFAAVIILTVVSCGDSPYAVTAMIDGQPWESDGYTNANEGTDTSGSKFIIVNAYSDNNTFIGLQFYDYATPGTYELDGLINGFGYGNYNGSSATLTHRIDTANPGTYTITSFSQSDKKIAGTFSATAYNDNHSDSIIVIDGKFDLHFLN